MNQQRPPYGRDPIAWQEYLAEGNAKRARKRVGCDLLIRDSANRIFLVNPNISRIGIFLAVWLRRMNPLWTP